MTDLPDIHYRTVHFPHRWEWIDINTRRCTRCRVIESGDRSKTPGSTICCTRRV